jgi:hypothetical protein
MDSMVDCEGFDEFTVEPWPVAVVPPTELAVEGWPIAGSLLLEGLLPYSFNEFWVLV